MSRYPPRSPGNNSDEPLQSLIWSSASRAPLKRNRSHARLRLRDLQLAWREGAPDIDDTLLPVNVTFFERDPLCRPQSGRGREQDHRAVPRPDRPRDRLELRPRLERVLLLPPPYRVVDADLRWIDVKHPQA